ncbi:MAG: imidazolonepropionase [Bacteroidota bacterium]
MKLLLKNIAGLVQVRETGNQVIKGAAMNELPVLHNAWLAIENGLIVEYGLMEDWGGLTDWRDLTIIDCDGKFVFPSWIDSHTHLVYAGSREQEFTDRINGLSYEEIAVRGGGILNSSDKLRTASEDELFDAAMTRLKEIIRQGTGAVEIKSGYGLSTESELKMLRVIKKIREHSPIPVKATFLGAHAVPREFAGRSADYLELIKTEMLPAIADEKLADYCDIFCERNYFSEAETVELMQTAKEFGLTPKVHANQMSRSGGVQAGVQSGAVSVDHLEYVEQEEIDSLLNSDTMPTILPGAQLFIGLPHPPARTMIDAGLPLAIASDFNPGTSPSGNMNLMVSLSCILYKMTPNEAINAATLNSAYAMGVIDELGSITIGKRANLFITKAIPSVDFLPYSFGSNLIETVILDGKIYN